MFQPNKSIRAKTPVAAATLLSLISFAEPARAQLLGATDSRLDLKIENLSEVHPYPPTETAIIQNRQELNFSYAQKSGFWAEHSKLRLPTPREGMQWVACCTDSRAATFERNGVSYQVRPTGRLGSQIIASENLKFVECSEVLMKARLSSEPEGVWYEVNPLVTNFIDGGPHSIGAKELETLIAVATNAENFYTSVLRTRSGFSLLPAPIQKHLVNPEANGQAVLFDLLLDAGSLQASNLLLTLGPAKSQRILKIFGEKAKALEGNPNGERPLYAVQQRGPFTRVSCAKVIGRLGRVNGEQNESRLTVTFNPNSSGSTLSLKVAPGASDEYVNANDRFVPMNAAIDAFLKEAKIALNPYDCAKIARGNNSRESLAFFAYNATNVSYLPEALKIELQRWIRHSSETSRISDFMFVVPVANKPLYEVRDQMSVAQWWKRITRDSRPVATVDDYDTVRQAILALDKKTLVLHSKYLHPYPPPDNTDFAFWVGAGFVVIGAVGWTTMSFRGRGRSPRKARRGSAVDGR